VRGDLQMRLLPKHWSLLLGSPVCVRAARADTVRVCVGADASVAVRDEAVRNILSRNPAAFSTKFTTSEVRGLMLWNSA
jgi:hypothetical protein